MSVKEIAKEREIKEGTVLEHIAYLIEKKLDVDIDKFVTPLKQNKIVRAIKKVGLGKMTPIMEKLGGEESGVSWDEIRFVIAQQKALKQV